MGKCKSLDNNLDSSYNRKKVNKTQRFSNQKFTVLLIGIQFKNKSHFFNEVAFVSY